MLEFNEQTEENLQCGFSGTPKGGGGSGAASSKKASEDTVSSSGENTPKAMPAATSNQPKTRMPKTERIERANSRMGVQVAKAAEQQTKAFLAIKKARAEGNQAEVKKQQENMQRAKRREYQAGKRARLIARIASPD